MLLKLQTSNSYDIALAQIRINLPKTPQQSSRKDFLRVIARLRLHLCSPNTTPQRTDGLQMRLMLRTTM